MLVFVLMLVVCLLVVVLVECLWLWVLFGVGVVWLVFGVLYLDVVGWWMLVFWFDVYGLLVVWVVMLVL